MPWTGRCRCHEAAVRSLAGRMVSARSSSSDGRREQRDACAWAVIFARAGPRIPGTSASTSASIDAASSGSRVSMLRLRPPPNPGRACPSSERQQLADRLRVPGLGQRGEPHHVAEQQRAHPPLRGRGPAWPRKSCDGGCRGSRRRHRGYLGKSGAAGAAKTLPRSQRRTARRAGPHRSATISAELVAFLQSRTAPPAPHAPPRSPPSVR